MMKNFLTPLFMFAAIAVMPFGEKAMPQKWQVARELPLMEFNELAEFQNYTKFFCSDEVEQKYSCFSIRFDREVMLTVDIDGTDYFFGLYNLKTSSKIIRLSYYTGSKEIWSFLDDWIEPIQKNEDGNLLWKNKSNQVVIYKELKDGRFPASR